MVDSSVKEAGILLEASKGLPKPFCWRIDNASICIEG